MPALTGDELKARAAQAQGSLDEVASFLVEVLLEGLDPTSINVEEMRDYLDTPHLVLVIGASVSRSRVNDSSEVCVVLKVPRSSRGVTNAIARTPMPRGKWRECRERYNGAIPLGEFFAIPEGPMRDQLHDFLHLMTM